MTISVAPGPATQEGTRTGTAESTDSLTAPDIPWNLVIWNDPVNLMSYVSYVFQSYFGYSESKANKLMMEVHRKGCPSWPRAARNRWNATRLPCTDSVSGP